MGRRYKEKKEKERKQKQKSEPSRTHVQDIFFAETNLFSWFPFASKIAKKVLHRPVRKREVHGKNFSLNFSGTAHKWHWNLLSFFYKKHPGAISCFFTDHGVSFVVFLVLGMPEAKKPFILPKSLKAYVKDREKTQQEKKKSLVIDEESIKEEIIGNEYRFEYEGTWIEHNTEMHLFEYMLCEGMDKVVMKAIVPKTLDQSIKEDIKKIAKSLKMRN